MAGKFSAAVGYSRRTVGLTAGSCKLVVVAVGAGLALEHRQR